MQNLQKKTKYQKSDRSRNPGLCCTRQLRQLKYSNFCAITAFVMANTEFATKKLVWKAEELKFNED